MTDNIDDLMSDLYWLDSGFHRHVNSETGAMAIFPETAKSEHDWEARALAMHENQRTIIPAPKPRENAMTRITRGD